MLCVQEGIMKKFILILTILIMSVAMAAWAFYKPVRVIAPGLVDSVSCATASICVDDESRYSEATKLYKDALSIVEREIGSFNKHPRVIFCSTERCFQSFGFNKASANAVGRLGIVVSPRGWKGYYIRHEMIHHRQAEELGMFAVLLKPRWFIEGMAYSLSDDPRSPLSEPWQSYRIKFHGWLQEVGNERLWDEAKQL
jgi:hypothetical protein